MNNQQDTGIEISPTIIEQLKPPRTMRTNAERWAEVKRLTLEAEAAGKVVCYVNEIHSRACRCIRWKRDDCDCRVRFEVVTL